MNNIDIVKFVSMMYEIKECALQRGLPLDKVINLVMLSAVQGIACHNEDMMEGAIQLGKGSKTCYLLNGIEDDISLQISIALESIKSNILEKRCIELGMQKGLNDDS
jgi:hypothetical protein